MSNQDQHLSCYNIMPSPEAKELLSQATELRDEIESFRNRKEKSHLWPAIQEKLRIEWTHHSNAIEGSTLSLGETIFFLQHGITVEGKPFKDFLDARNHAEALDMLYEYIYEQRPISESLIKETNALLLHGVTHTASIDQFGRRSKKEARPGQYKSLPNSVLQPDGSIHEYVDPLHVGAEMEALCVWVGQHLDTLHPIITAATAHYNMVRIHPFDDGNGRGARILMNMVLLKKKYPPAIVQIEQRRAYINAIVSADQGDMNPFVLFICQSLIQTQQSILEVLRGKL